MKDVSYYLDDKDARVRFVGEFIVIETHYDKFGENKNEEEKWYVYWFRQRG